MYTVNMAPLRSNYSDLSCILNVNQTTTLHRNILISKKPLPFRHMGFIFKKLICYKV